MSIHLYLSSCTITLVSFISFTLILNYSFIHDTNSYRTTPLKSRRVTLDDEDLYASNTTNRKADQDSNIQNSEKFTMIGNSDVTLMRNYHSAVEEGHVLLDILSIGSKTRKDQMLGQINSMAMHPMLRSYWWVTEFDDFDKLCTETMDTHRYINHCRNSRNPWNISAKSSKMAQMIRLKHYSEANLAVKGYTPEKSKGWLCAQRRVGFGIGKRCQAYRETQDLPDYLILLDDDSYVNIDKFLNRMKSKNTTLPYVYAGRIFEFSDKMTFPWGGYGVIMNRASLVRFIQPLHCVFDFAHSYGRARNFYSSDFEARACMRMNLNILDEKSLFNSGMSLSDLAYAMSARNYFCMHSDHLVGYFINHYLLSELVPGGETRIHQYGKNRYETKSFCGERSHICHGMNRSDFLKRSLFLE